MTTSLFLARLLGPLLLLAGIGIAFNRDFYRAVAGDFLANRGLVYFGGAALLLGGTALILTHNVWAADWRIIITLIGWLTALRGAALIIAPQWTIGLAERWVRWPQLFVVNAVIVIVLGLVLSAVGYSQ
jgi:hypothetical protein